MQSVEISGMDEIQRALENFPKVVGKAKGELLDGLGRMVLEDVRRRIGGTGRVAGGQDYYVGSGKGYVAVRPKAEAAWNGYRAGYVTNALEHGHVISNGSVCSASRVPGKYMYQTVQAQLNGTLEPFSRQLQQTILDSMWG